jgi:hypothetical protein
MFGTVVIAWQWLSQGQAIVKCLETGKGKKENNFYMGKLRALQFFFEYELNNIEGLSMRLLNNDGLSVQMESGQF